MQDLNPTTEYAVKRAAWFEIIEDYNNRGQSQVDSRNRPEESPA